MQTQRGGDLCSGSPCYWRSSHDLSVRGPGFWQAATQADFLRGEVDQLSIDEHGRLTLGPELTRVHDAAAPFVWTALAGADGALFLGTGNDGKVIKVDKGGQASVFYDSTEMEVHALAAAPGGGLFAATSPDGRIYKLDAKGQATPFFDPDDKYIWSLAVDRDGNVFAGTGDKGTVYKITPDGKGQKFFATKASHAVALAFDQNRQLLVGTGTPGRVFRVDGAGKGFLLLDTTYQEVRALRVDPKGVIYAAAQSSPRVQGGGDSLSEALSAPPPVTPSIPNVSTEITSIVGRGSRLGVAVRRHRHCPRTGAIQPARCSACSPTDCGTRCGRRVKMRRTTSPSKPTVRCWSPRERRASCFA